MQKYKVFFNSRIVYLSQFKLKNVDRFYEFENKENLFMQIEKFIKNEKVESLNIFSNDLEKLFADFKSYFVFLEASGGIVRNKLDKILFIFRLGKWDLPKGKIEKDENPEKAAIREIEEECGISETLITSKLMPTYHTYFLNDNYYLKKTHWFNMKYYGNQVLVPQTEEDISEVKWIDKKELDMVIENTYLSIKDVLQNCTYTN